MHTGCPAKGSGAAVWGTSWAWTGREGITNKIKLNVETIIFDNGLIKTIIHYRKSFFAKRREIEVTGDSVKNQEI